MADFFMDRLYRQVTLEHIKSWDGFSWTDEKIKAREFENWKHRTRIMFEMYPAIEIFEAIEEAIKEASDSQYYEQKVYARMRRSVSIREGIKKNPRVRGVVREEIDKHFKITEIAKQFGLHPDPKGRINCPFHDDGDPSCFLNDDKNIFHCFGCDAKGDVIEFYRRLKNER